MLALLPPSARPLRASLKKDRLSKRTFLNRIVMIRSVRGPAPGSGWRDRAYWVCKMEQDKIKILIWQLETTSRNSRSQHLWIRILTLMTIYRAQTPSQINQSSQIRSANQQARSYKSTFPAIIQKLKKSSKWPKSPSRPRPTLSSPLHKRRHHRASPLSVQSAPPDQNQQHHK